MISLPEPSPIERFEQCLARHGRRMTKQRQMLATHVFDHCGRFNADELIKVFQIRSAATRISRPTIYRTLAELVNCGLLRRMEEDGTSVYEPTR